MRVCRDMSMRTGIRISRIIYPRQVGWSITKEESSDGKAKSKAFKQSLRQKRNIWQLTILQGLQFGKEDVWDMSDNVSSPTPVAVDNQAAIRLAKNKTSHDSTKHIHFRCHYIRSLITSKNITLPYIDTNHNHADVFTKVLTRDKRRYHVSGLGVQEPNVGCV